MRTGRGKLQHRCGNRFGIVARDFRKILRLGAVVRDSQTSAGVEKANGVAVGTELPHQIGGALHGLAERLDVGNLRADVQAHARDFKVLAFGDAAKEITRRSQGNAKFVLVKPGGDVRVRLSRDIRVDAQGDVRRFAQRGHAPGQKLKLTLAFHVEEQNAAFDGRPQLFGGFAHAGKYHFLYGPLIGRTNALEFAAGDNVEARSQFGQHTQNAEMGIRLYGKAKRMGQSAKSLVEDLIELANGGGGIKVKRRAIFFRQRADRHTLAVKLAFVVLKPWGTNKHDEL